MADYSLTAQGRSLDNVVGAGAATFFIPRTTHQVVVGFSRADTPPYGANHILFGVHALSGALAWFMDGQQYSVDHPLGSYSGEDEIRIEFNGITVRIYVSGFLRGEFDYLVEPTEELYLAAAFARPDDLIHTPTLYDRTSVARVAKLDATLPAVGAFISEAAGGAAVNAVMAPLAASIAQRAPGAYVDAVMAPLTASLFATGPNSGSLNAVMQPLGFFGDARSGPPRPVVLDATLAPLGFGGYSVTGGLGSVQGSMAPMAGFIAERVGGYLFAEMAPMSGHLSAQPGLPTVSVALILQLGLSVEVESISTVDVAFGLQLGLQVDVAEATTVDVEFGLELGLDFEAVAAETVAVGFGLSFGLDVEVSTASVVDLALGLQLSLDWEGSSVSTVDVQLGMRLGLRFNVSAAGDDGTEVWVLNVKSGGSTRYTNYPFNSFARIGDQFYGAGQGGLYLLDGPDDAGAEIASVIDLGRLDFGGSQKKTVAQCYISMTAEAPLLLSVDAEGATYVYPTRSYSEHLRQGRVTPGKGLKSNYVNLQLMNQDGADFEVDGVEIIVADLTRRI
ncbi:hypothetical protein [Xenophilus sp. Marseille-Q4582]|uniref:hypothetical protein n=1 Tax=Xenophilus sp. Marseille-Q4582 TaxID=2866600 RepID=UPI001CE3C335|nr:hypothetical protein [Xenophilus sp. Marseille-Q4582]